jgi:hypothetical protein
LIEFLSHLELVIAIAPVFVFGMLLGLVGLYFARRERLKSVARHDSAEAGAENSAAEKPKAAHA